MPNDQPDWISPTAQVQREIGSLTPAAGATLSASFPVPAECQALGFLVDLKNGIFVPTNLTVQGDQTGLFYFNTVTPTGIINLEHRALADTSVTLLVQSPAAGPAKVRLLAYTAHPIVSVRNVSNTPLTVDVTDRAGRQLGDIVDRIERALGHVRIQDWSGTTTASVFAGTTANDLSVVQKDPEPWQAPRAWARSRVVANGVTTLVAASGTQHIFVFGWYLGMDGSTNGVLAHMQDGGAKAFAALSGNGAGLSLVSVTGYHNGLDLGAGARLDLNADSIPAGGAVEAIVSYSQA